MPAPKRHREQPATRRAAPASAATPSNRRTALVLFVLLLAIYVPNFRLRGAGDSLPTRVLPFSLLREGNLDLDEFTWERVRSNLLPYYVHKAGEHIYSVSTIATALVVTPLYVLPAWYLAAAEVPYDDVRARVVIVVMERIAAATLAALAASLLFLVLRRLTTWRWALALALFYGLGTTTWVISSQALWAHALSQLTLVILTLILLHPNPSLVACALAGLVAGVAVANRPQAIVFAALAFAFVARHQPRRLPAFAALPALIGLALMAYNRAIFQGLTGGYGGIGHFTGPVLEGIVGLFVSPNRGLLVFTPIMVFALWGAVRIWRLPVPPWLRWLTIGVALHVVMHAAFKEWWAGYTYGPRYLTDVLPALTIFLVYGLVPLWRMRWVRVIAVLFAAYGVVVQAIGVYAADDAWNREPLPLEVAPQRVWDWSDLQIVRGLRNGWRGGELLPVMIDAFRDPLPARLAELTQADLHAAIKMRPLPRAMQRGELVRRYAWVKNLGAKTWPAFTGEGVISARYLTFLLVRWLDAGVPLAGVGDVLPLPLNLAHGETVRMPVEIVAPGRAGELELELRVTQAIDGMHGIVGADALRMPVRVE